ncbi:hypothetical protein ACA910_000533 [Epithemia clementina (nom. ined.)]
MSACAAVVRITDEDKDVLGPPREYLGGRTLTGDGSVLTSADAEYEGLILGLEYLIALLGNVLTSSNNASREESLWIVVYGDCKTVIRQMQGRSRPRKMDAIFKRARSLVDTLPWNITFEHIPRSENILSDRLCGQITRRMENAAIERLLADMVKFDEGTTLQLRRRMLSTRNNQSAIDSPNFGSIEDLLSIHFKPHKSLIPFSKRPFLYYSLARIANLSLDFKSMVSIGEKMEEEAKSIWMKQSVEVTEKAQWLLFDGLNCQLAGLKGLAKQKDVSRIMRQHKNLLQKHSSFDLQSGQERWRDQYHNSLCNEDLLLPLHVSSWDKEHTRLSMPVDASTPFWTQV